jgi:hypothetical protein
MGVGRVGVEPTRFGLKARCSTTELPAHQDGSSGFKRNMIALLG